MKLEYEKLITELNTLINSYRKDIYINALGNVIPLIAAIITVPELVKSLEVQSFGIITLIWSLVGYFGIFDLGVGRALTYEIRMAITSDHKNEVGSIIKSGVLIALLTGFFGAVLIGFILAPNAASWFKITENSNQIDNVFKIIALSILPTTFFSCLKGALEALGNFTETNTIRAFIGSMMFIIPYLEVRLGDSNLINIAIGIAIMRFLILGITLYWLRTLIFEKPKLKPKTNKYYTTKLLGYGFWVTLSSIISPIMVYGDRFIITGLVGVSEIIFYAIPQEGIQRLLLIPGTITTALLPRLISSVENTNLKKLYLESKRRVAIVMLGVCIACAILSHKVLAYWINSEFSDKAYPIVLVLLIGIWFNSIAQFSISILLARKQPKRIAIIHIIELFFYIIFIYGFIISFGILGAALAWSIRTIIDYFILDYFAKRELA